MSNLFDFDFAKKENTDVVSFRPEKDGELVEGTVVALSTTNSEYTSDLIPVIRIQTDEGVVREVRGYHSVLRARLQERNVAVGDKLGVRYDGKKPTKDGKRSYHAYSVVVVKSDETKATNNDPWGGDTPNF